MKIGIACGGTGGHIFPGLAVAGELRKRGHEVKLWMAGKDIENEALKEWGGSVVTLPSRGFQGRNPLRHIQTIFRLALVRHRCCRLMRAEHPDLILAMGSYASIGPGLAAKSAGVPLLLHEANVIPGRANRLLAPYAARIAVNFEETSYHMRNRHVLVTGMPLRPELQSASEEEESMRSEEGFRLLVMGGSRGARALNRICPRAAAMLAERDIDLGIVHLAGESDRDGVEDIYRSSGVNAEVHAFQHDISSIYRRSDLAICRAGASTCAELGAFGLPSLLVPYPHAANKHQMRNAEAMERRGAANLIDQNDLSAEWLADYLLERIKDPRRMAQMRANTLRHRIPNASSALADLVEETGLKI